MRVSLMTRSAPLLILLIALSAPAEAQERRSGEASSPALEGEGALRFYEAPARTFAYEMSLEREMASYRRYKVTFASAIRSDFEPNNTVHAVYYQPKRGDGPAPGVVILHHLGGGSEPEEFLASYLSQHRVAALVLTLPFYGPRRPRDLERRAREAGPDGIVAIARQAVHDTRACADLLRSLPEVDAERVGVLGISLGAILGSLSAGVDGRFHKAVLVLGGGRLDEVFFHGAREVRAIREYCEAEGISKAALKEMLAPVDPVTFASRLDAEDVLMLNASRDEIIPRVSTDALHEALGAPKIHWYKTGHYGAALHVLNIMRRSLDWLQ